MGTRLSTWLGAGGRLIFSHWNLDASATLQTALQVSTVSFNTARNIYPAAATTLSFFDQQNAIMSPLVATDTVTDDGDELTPTGGGFVAGHFDSATGAGAIAVTRNRHVVVDGFVFRETTGDADSDGIPDAQELVENQINYLMNPVVLVDNGGTSSDSAVHAVQRIGYTVIRTTGTTSFDTAFDAGNFDAVIIAVASGGYDSTVETRVTSWVGAGGVLIYSYWDLDAAPAAQTALGVTTTSFNTIRPVYEVTGQSVDFFATVDDVPSPLTGTDSWFDDGDALALSGAGFLAGRFNSTTGSGAIAVTHSGRVIVDGFLFDEFATPDVDADGIPDVQELIENQLHYLFLP